MHPTCAQFRHPDFWWNWWLQITFFCVWFHFCHTNFATFGGIPMFSPWIRSFCNFEEMESYFLVSCHCWRLMAWDLCSHRCRSLKSRSTFSEKMTWFVYIHLRWGLLFRMLSMVGRDSLLIQIVSTTVLPSMEGIHKYDQQTPIFQRPWCAT